jgi:hypothetical protein
MLRQGVADIDDEPDGRGFFAIKLPVRLLAASAVIAGLTMMVRLSSSPPAVVPLQPVAPRQVLLDVAPLRLAEPGIDPVRVEPGRIDARTGLREDILGRGRFEAIEAPTLRLAMTRGIGAERAPSLFVLLARRAAQPLAGGDPLAVMRTGARGAVGTRFGTVETMDAVLAGSATRTCTGFLAVQDGLRLDGFLCAPLGGAPDARMLACTLDALALDDPSDPTASATFRNAKGRSDCDRPGIAVTDPVGRTGSISRRRPDTKN